MNTLNFLIIADRAQLKAYRVDHPTARGAAPHLVESLRLSEPGERFAERYTDQAGSFPNGGKGGQGNSVAEHMTIKAETDSRAFRSLAAQIHEWIGKYRPTGWALAAPAEIKHAIADGLPAETKRLLRSIVGKDLVNVPESELLGHFEQAGV